MNMPVNPAPAFALPAGFRFSQSSLQDYVDCRRRFQLRYLQNLAWPALQSEPALENERFMLRGSLFHQLTQQFFSGVPADRLQAAIADPHLAGWWELVHALCATGKAGPAPIRPAAHLIC